MNIRPIAKGLLTFIPAMRSILPKGRTGGTDSARYCRDVWLKHFTKLPAGSRGAMPGTLAELGPGDSIGVGLAALLLGVNRYFALDVVRYSDTGTNLRMLNELAGLLGAHDDPLIAGRIPLIRSALLSPGSDQEGIVIRYMVPWSDARVIEPGTVDLILSHATLEHVVDLPGTYRALAQWLKPGGMMSHEIDFRSHGITKQWNGYRAYPEILWKIIAGRRIYLINREPCSVHLGLMKKNGFEIVSMEKQRRTDGVSRTQLSSRWRGISDDDLECSDLFVQARKL